MMKTSGIYKIQSTLYPDRVYIGSAVNINNRKNHHLSLLRNHKHSNKKLQGHYDEYGENDIVFSILAVCDKSDLIPENNVIWLEQCFILAYRPSFNICKVAGSSIGQCHSKKWRVDHSNKMKGKGNPMFGKHFSDESKQKMRDTLGDKLNGVSNPFFGKTHSEETRNKMKESWVKRKLIKVIK
jgi:group I intron endonuclease